MGPNDKTPMDELTSEWQRSSDAIAYHFTADPCSSRPSARMTRITVPNSGFPSGESAL